jgi:hypothetical protein
MQTCYSRAFDVRTATICLMGNVARQAVDHFCHGPDAFCIGSRHQQAFDKDVTRVAAQPPDGFP